MKRKHKSNQINHFAIFSYILIVSLILSISFTLLKHTQPDQKETLLLPREGVTIVINVPAVDNKGEGALTKLEVNAKPGVGKSLVDINTLTFWSDTQESIRTAKNVAGEVLNIDVSQYDVTYTLSANASLIGGPSAGAALTIATIAALENKNIRDDVLITGSINPDGTIGQVGQVNNKAKIAENTQANLFLVPSEQGGKTVYELVKTCENINGIKICSIDQVETRVSNSNEKIQIIEVQNIKEALKYFY